jgi:hypothetical protein
MAEIKKIEGSSGAAFQRIDPAIQSCAAPPK